MKRVLKEIVKEFNASESATIRHSLRLAAQELGHFLPPADKNGLIHGFSKINSYTGKSKLATRTKNKDVNNARNPIQEELSQ